MGGHGSGLFHGTSGEGLPALLAGDRAAKPASAPSYTATANLRRHITEAYDNGRQGIGGGHERSAFEAKLTEMGGKVEERVPCESIDGVEKIIYRLPKKGPDGKPTEEMRAKTYSKTVYDANKISTDEYMRRGVEAANDAAKGGRLPREWSGTDSRGVRWHGYTENDKIKSFYPEF